MNKEGIYFIYDGQCPLCSSAAHALRIKEAYGVLYLINARQDASHPLIQDVTRQGLDLDEGMVIYADDRFYHGKEALKFMARYGQPRNMFTALCKSLFWSDSISTLMYPWMRGTRNMLLWQRRVGQIDNLNLKQAPTFKAIFGDDWDKLPPVMHKHYANKPYTNDLSICEGTLDVICKAPLTWLAPLMMALGQVPAHNETNVPVTVRFQSDKDSRAFHFKRSFQFKTRNPYAFHSRMIQIRNNEVIEVMRFGIGWKMLYLWDGKKVVLQHRGYALYIGGMFIPVPLTLFLGKGYAEEIAVDDATFDMITHITHPLWGRVYQYKGRFKMTKEI